jgi:hypothetical protein
MKCRFAYRAVAPLVAVAAPGELFDSVTYIDVWL